MPSVTVPPVAVPNGTFGTYPGTLYGVGGNGAVYTETFTAPQWQQIGVGSVSEVQLNGSDGLLYGLAGNGAVFTEPINTPSGTNAWVQLGTPWVSQYHRSRRLYLRGLRLERRVSGTDFQSGVANARHWSGRRSSGRNGWFPLWPWRGSRRLARANGTPAGTSAWVEIGGPWVSYFSLGNDGYIYGIGGNGAVYRELISSPVWQQIGIGSVSQIQFGGDGFIYGLGLDNIVYRELITTPSGVSGWMPIGTNWVSNFTMQLGTYNNNLSIITYTRQTTNASETVTAVATGPGGTSTVQVVLGIGCPYNDPTYTGSIDLTAYGMVWGNTFPITAGPSTPDIPFSPPTWCYTPTDSPQICQSTEGYTGFYTEGGLNYNPTYCNDGGPEDYCYGCAGDSVCMVFHSGEPGHAIGNFSGPVRTIGIANLLNYGFPRSPVRLSFGRNPYSNGRRNG